MKAFKILIFLFFTCFSAIAQDIHFSQFYLSPLTVNPAKAGVFNGDYRISGIHRNQWNSVTIPYVTTGLGYDFPWKLKSMEKHRFTTALHLLADKAGDPGWAQFQAGITLGFLMNVGGDSTNFLSFAFDNAVTQRSFDYSKLTFDQQYTGDSFEPAAPTGESFADDKIYYFDFSAGVNWHSIIDERTNWSAGIGFFHINKPSLTFYNEDNFLNNRISFSGNARFPAGDKIDLLPAFILQFQTPFTEIIGGTSARWNIENMKNINGFYLGGWIRPGDAIILSTGIDWRSTHLGFSYDINTSELKTASRGRGAFEIALVHIIRKVKPVNLRQVGCPIY